MFFANTNTSVSILFVDKSITNDNTIFVDASRKGKTEKVNDISRVILSPEEEKEIVDVVLNLSEVNEFSKLVSNNEIKENDKMLKPGLYFDIKYNQLGNYLLDLSYSKTRFIQKQRGLIKEFSRDYARNLFIKKFVNFDSLNSTKMIDTSYGKIPENYSLVELKDLLEDTIGGDWGREKADDKYSKSIYCIRGMDIPNINFYNYKDLPIRYCKNEIINIKKLLPGDIVIEISGGSPVQSTGRLCYIDNYLLKDMKYPVLCTNFCRILRFKNKKISAYVFDYLNLLYDRGYFFNLENNTTGIKNLLINSFIQNIKIVIPDDFSVIETYYQDIENYINEIFDDIVTKK